MSGRTEESFIAEEDKILECLVNLSPEDRRDRHVQLLYRPVAALPNLLAKLEAFVAIAKPTKEERTEAGKLLEQISLAAFAGLPYEPPLRSYQSAGPQIDLMVNGSNGAWERLMVCLRLDKSKRGILVEAKATDSSVSTAQFLRLCGMIQVNLTQLVSLGVFVTINGATGIPSKGEARQRVLRDVRLEQALVNARHGIPVVVLDLHDLRRLNEAGALVKILDARVQEIDVCAGLDPVNHEELHDLPEHLKSIV